jgi:Family of unknown function (DUF5372)
VKTTERHTTHQQRPAEVTIHYSFHPLRTQTLPVVRLYDFEQEANYVVRRADGTPVAVAAWMTRPEAAFAKIIPVARLPVRVLLELHRIVAICFSTHMDNVHEENQDAPTQNNTPTPTLRRTAGSSRSAIPAKRARPVTPSARAVAAGVGKNDPAGGAR